MKVILSTIENYAMNTALLMFLGFCALSLIAKEFTIMRNILFLLLGFSGLIISNELEDFLRTRLAGKKKRTLRVAQSLLLAFSLILCVFAMFETGLLTSLSRWD